ALVAGGYRALALRLIDRRLGMSLVAAIGFGVGCLLLNAPTMIPMALIVVGRGANLDWVSHGFGQPGRAGVSQLVTAAGMLATTLAVSAPGLVAGGFGLSALLGLAVSGAAAGRALIRLKTEVPPGPEAEDRGRSEPTMWSMAWVLVMTLSDQTMATADIALLGWLDSVENAGVYATVYRLPNAVLMIGGVISAAAVPVVARTIGRRGCSSVPAAGLYRVGLAGSALVILVAGPLSAAAPTLFGPEYAAGQPALVVLFAAGAVITFSIPFRVVHLADRPGRRLGVLFLLGAVANLVMNAVAIPVAGMVGAAVTTMLVQSALGWALVTRRPGAFDDQSDPGRQPDGGGESAGPDAGLALGHRAR
ncbi:MAG: hypothetical protein OER95_15115, partial [Acidimicrobiia bacterium]|nr:hypothetical protein [Acidimicrobiia bacterium]